MNFLSSLQAIQRHNKKQHIVKNPFVAYLLLHDGYRSHIVALVTERSLCNQVTNSVYFSTVMTGHKIITCLS